MRPRTKRNRYALLLAMLATACGENTAIIEPPANLTIQIQPHTIAGIVQGVTFPLSVDIEGALAPLGIQWQSSNPAIASVDANGVVNGIAAGTVWIKAFATEFPTVRDSIQLIVVEQVATADQPSVWIASVRKHESASAVDTMAVSGQIDVAAAHDFPLFLVYNAAMQVRLNNQVVCTYAVMQQTATDNCTIDTRLFANGRATLRIFAVRADGTVFASATYPPLLIFN